MPGTQLQSMDNTLSQITNAPASQIQQGYNTATQGALNMQQNQPDPNQVYQGYSQQLTAPLYGQQDKMQQMFKMYLADQGLAQKYGADVGAGTNMNPYIDPTLMASSMAKQNALTSGNQADMTAVTNMTTAEQPGATIATPTSDQTTANPYLASPSDIMNSVANAPQAPGLTTAEMAQPLQGGNQMLYLLNSLIGSENTLAQGASQSALQTYNNKLNTLSTLANLLSGELGRRNTSATSGYGGYSPGSDAEAGAYYQGIKDKLGANATAGDIWNYINSNMDTIKAQKGQSFVDKLWKYQAGDRARSQGGVVGTGKITTSKTLKSKQDAKGDTIFTMPNGGIFNVPTRSFWDNIIGNKKPSLTDPTTGKQYVYNGLNDQDFIKDIQLGWQWGGWQQ